MKGQTHPFISVIIAERNSSRTIRACLQSILALEYPAFEIIVFDDASTDTTPVIIAEFSSRIRIIAERVNRGPGEGRTIAARQAAGEYIAFTDGDCIVDRRWLAELAAGFTGEGVAGVGGSQAVPGDESAFGRKVAVFLASTGFISEYHRTGNRGTIARVEHNASCNVMYRKDLFLSVGGFRPGLWPGEDVELDYRLRKRGTTLNFNPRATVFHYRPADMASFQRMMRRYGWAQGYLVRLHGVTRKVQAVPFLLALFLIAGVLLPSVWVVVVPAVLALVFTLTSFNLEQTALALRAAIAWHWGFFQGLAENPKSR